MPFIAGIYQRYQNWVARQAAGKNISAVEFDADGIDVATALSTCLLRDGTSLPTVDIPFGGKGITGIRQAVANGEPVEFGQFSAQLTTVASATNLLHNPSFTVNQRGVYGTVTLAAGVYGHDRWKAGASGCTYTFGGSGPDMTLAISAGSLLQIVPASSIDAGTYTLQNAGTAQGRVNGGAYVAGSQQVALSEGSPITVEFATGTILKPQLASGSSVRTFSRRAQATEDQICKSYYEKTYYIGAVGGRNSPIAFTQVYAARKVAVPTVTVDAPGSSSYGTQDYWSVGVPVGSGAVQAIFYLTASCEP